MEGVQLVRVCAVPPSAAPRSLPLKRSPHCFFFYPASFPAHTAAEHDHLLKLLLVGDTGSGKTTAAALAAALRGLDIVTVSCSRHTEAADFVGGYRPVR